MNTTKILLGLGVVAVIGTATVLMNPMSDSFEQGTSELEYTPRNAEIDARLSGGNAEIQYLLKRNVHTNQLERTDYLNARSQARSMPTDRLTFTWEELGPDNIGGRTRGILIDKDDDNIVWAGSVSGGLYKSTDAGNNWSRVTTYTENLAISSISQAGNGNIFVATGHAEEGINGNGSSGGFGDGVWMSSDDGATWTQVTGSGAWAYINETVSDQTQSEKVYFATSNNGLQLYENGSLSTVTSGSWTANNISALDMSPDGQIMVLGEFAVGIKTHVSADGGNTWTDVSGNGVGQIPSSGIGRLEYSISHSTNDQGFYNIYASMATSGGRLRGVWMSNDNGSTWYEIAPNTSGQDPDDPNSFTPFSTSRSAQGRYNNIITVFPTNPEKILLGGIDVYGWDQASNNPPYGQWEQRSLWFASQQSPVYVHADNHEFQWDSQGNLYIGNDGGIGKSPAGQVLGEIFFPSNRGYNVTQFYSVAMGKFGEVMGGTQDNGTLLNDYTGTTPLEFREVMGGDGFDCDISFLSSDVIFTSVYNGSIVRSDDRGFTAASFYSADILALGEPGQTLGSFYTVGRLWETDDDPNSQDTILYVPFDTILPGDTIPNLTSSSLNIELFELATDTLCYVDTLMADGFDTDSLVYDSSTMVLYNMDTVSYYVINTDSLFNNTTMDTILIDSLTFDTAWWAFHPCSAGDTVWMDMEMMTEVGVDTFKVVDPIQSWYALGLGGSNGVWVTREAIRFSSDPQWFQVLGGTNASEGGNMGTVKSIEFSKDGNHMYVGTWNGELWRVSNLNTIYSSNPFAEDAANVGSGTRTVTSTLIYDGNASAAVTGISVDPYDPGHVVITLGSYGLSSHVLESFTADVTAGTASFSSIQGNLPDMPAYDVAIDKEYTNSNSQTIIVGTEFGVYVTDDGGSTWSNSSGPFGNTPVYAVRQQHKEWFEGAAYPGEIYIGTHGRGIFKTGDLLSIHETPPMFNDEAFISELVVYPNPMTDQGTVTFDLLDDADVEMNVYSITGTLVQTQNWSGMAAGERRIELNANELQSGIYFVELVTGNERKTAKFIVNR